MTEKISAKSSTFDLQEKISNLHEGIKSFKERLNAIQLETDIIQNDRKPKNEKRNYELQNLLKEKKKTKTNVDRMYNQIRDLKSQLEAGNGTQNNNMKNKNPETSFNLAGKKSNKLTSNLKKNENKNWRELSSKNDRYNSRNITKYNDDIKVQEIFENSLEFLVQII